jgi:uncharacterized Zn-finger protein
LVSFKSNKSGKITPPKTGKFDGITIADELMGPEKIELICNYCSTGPLVKLSDGGANEQMFCTHCSTTYSMEDDTVRHKQRLSVPEETEPDIASVGTVPDVSIRHEPELRGGFAGLAKKGTIHFTSYNTTEKE